MRDPLYESEWLKQIADTAARLHGIDDSPLFTRAIVERLAIGAERYGDNDFVSKDVLAEALEETPDVAAYCLLETLKLNAGIDGDAGPKYQHLLEAAVHAAVADWHVRQARRLP